MAHSIHHAESSAKKFGGEAREYLHLHQFLETPCHYFARLMLEYEVPASAPA